MFLNRQLSGYNISFLGICFFMICIFTKQVYGQKTYLPQITGIATESSINEEVFSASLHPRITNANSVSQYNINPMVLDSVSEMIKEAYYTENIQWYYHYSDLKKLDSITTYYFDENGEFKNVLESRKYNSSGKIVKFVRSKYDLLKLQNSGDTSFIVLYTEKYQYANNKLTLKVTENQDLTFPGWGNATETTEHFYTYSEQGNLIRDSLRQEGGPTTETRLYVYYYNDENKIQYVVDKLFSQKFIGLDSYTYEVTDSSSRTKCRYGNMYTRRTDTAAINSLATWKSHALYVETYDNKGRTKSLEATGNTYFRYLDRDINYRIEYTYTDWDSIQHATYYFQDEVYGNGEWKEFMRENYSYDRFRNIVLYERTVYDLWTDTWDLKQRREYFYSNGSGIVPIENHEITGIRIYPNPASDYFIIENKSDNGNLDYQLFNINGTVLNSGFIQSNVEQVDLSSFPTSVYFLKIYSKDTNKLLRVFKIVKR